MKAARVLVDGAWRDCIWMHPLDRSYEQGRLAHRSGDTTAEDVTAAMVGGLPLLEGTDHRYTVASNSKLYTIVVDMAFDGGNNLCKVLSVLDSHIQA